MEKSSKDDLIRQFSSSSKITSDDTLLQENKSIKYNKLNSYLKYDDLKFTIEILKDNNHSYNSIMKELNTATQYIIFKVVYEDSNSKIVWEIIKSKKELHDFLELILKDFHKNKTGLLKEHILEIKKLLKTNILIKHKISFCNLINMIAKNLDIMKKIYFLEFFEISKISFIYFAQGRKIKEGYAMKHSKPKQPGCCHFLMCCCVLNCRKFYRKWFILREDMVFFIDDSSCNMAMDV